MRTLPKFCFFLFAILFLFSCQRKNAKRKDKAEVFSALNLYDEIYVKMLSKNQPFSEIINIDSLYQIANTEYYFDLLKKRGILDSTKIDRINKAKPINIDIVVSDSLGKILKEKAYREQESEHSFSKPYRLDDNNIFIFKSVFFKPNASKIAIIFFKKNNAKQEWKIENIVSLGEFN